MQPDETLDRLVTEHGDRLLRLAYQLTHDRPAAEDVVQEALMNIYVSWRRRDPDVASIAAYARRAVVNAFLQRRRLRSSTEVVTDVLPVAPAPGADDGIADRDLCWRALGTLPPRQRAVLVLRYYEDLPDATIARLLGARPATVRSLAARGLAALRVPDLALRGGAS